jgi:hypothetical protein
MVSGDDVARAVEALAQGALDAQVRIVRLTTVQWDTGPGAASMVTRTGLSGGTALSSSGPGGSTLRFFMVGRDNLDSEQVVLG